MATDVQWLFITDKYSIVDHLDRSIVVARFNQNELMRDLIELRGKLLESKTYDDIVSCLDFINMIFENTTDERLSEILADLIDRVSSYKDGHLEIEKKIDEVGTKVME